MCVIQHSVNEVCVLGKCLNFTVCHLGVSKIDVIISIESTLSLIINQNLHHWLITDMDGLQQALKNWHLYKNSPGRWRKCYSYYELVRLQYKITQTNFWQLLYLIIQPLLLETGFIDAKEIFKPTKCKLTPHNSKPPHLYGLPKIHRSGSPLRPILASEEDRVTCSPLIPTEH